MNKERYNYNAHHRKQYINSHLFLDKFAGQIFEGNMYLRQDEHVPLQLKGERRFVGEVGPINWQQGITCQVLGWKRFSNSKWQRSHEYLKPNIQSKLQALRLSLNIPKEFNCFLSHMLICLLLSTILLVVGIMIEKEIYNYIAVGQFIFVNILYTIWTIVLTCKFREKMRKGLSKIEDQTPNIRLNFSLLCECCYNYEYVSVYEQL